MGDSLTQKLGIAAAAVAVIASTVVIACVEHDRREPVRVPSKTLSEPGSEDGGN